MARNYSGKGGGSDEQYLSKYCDMLIEHMSEGYSFSSFGADINKGRTTLHNWVEKYPEFKKAKEIGHERARKYYERFVRMKIKGESSEDFDPKKSDTALLIFFLKTRFRDEYTEKIEFANSDNEALKISYVIEKNGK